MRNLVSKGEVLTITTPSGGLTGGQPLCLGQIPLVATSDAVQGEITTAARTGVFSLPVHGHNGTENTAIVAGDQIYFDSSGPELNVKDSGVPYGKALTPVSGGATTTIEVLLD